MLYRIIPVNGIFFGNADLIFQVLLYTDMSPKTKYLVTDLLLKTIYKTQGNDHYCHT